MISIFTRRAYYTHTRTVAGTVSDAGNRTQRERERPWAGIEVLLAAVRASQRSCDLP